MERRLFILLLFRGLVPPAVSLGRKYFLIQEAKSWSDAQAYCRSVYTDLAIIRNDADMILLQKEAQTQLFSSSVWIGLYLNINSWRWCMGNEPLGTMRPWKPTEPSNTDGVQECGGIAPWGWVDLICSKLNAFVCFDSRFTGDQRYIFYPDGTAWHDAQAYCRQHHTDLASSRDEAEEAVIQGLISDWTWFGLFRDSWKWTDQTNFSTLSWIFDQPDNALKNETCGFIENGEAADAPCSDLLPFFCHAELRKRLIVGVKIQSSEDVNGPAVKVAILDKIKQKLKEKGMIEDITVKWRKLIDAEVFINVEK